MSADIYSVERNIFLMCAGGNRVEIVVMRLITVLSFARINSLKHLHNVKSQLLGFSWSSTPLIWTSNFSTCVLHHITSVESTRFCALWRTLRFAEILGLIRIKPWCSITKANKWEMQSVIITNHKCIQIIWVLQYPIVMQSKRRNGSLRNSEAQTKHQHLYREAATSSTNWLKLRYAGLFDQYS